MKVDISDFKSGGSGRDVSVEISGHDIYSLDITLAEIIYPALLKIKPHREDEVTDDMLFAFESIKEEKHLFANKETSERIQKGLRDFSDNYMSLWV